MNEQKFTQKTIEVIKNAQSLAIEHQNVQIEEEHLLYALIDQEDGLIPELIKKIGIDFVVFSNAVKKLVEDMPGVSGPGREAGKVYISQDADKVLVSAEKTADKMKDEYHKDMERRKAAQTRLRLYEADTGWNKGQRYLGEGGRYPSRV